MKMGFVALVLLIIISLLLIIFSGFLSDSVNYMANGIEKVDNLIEKNNLHKAEEAFYHIKSTWEDKEKIFRLQLESDSLEEIDVLFSQIASYFEENDFENYHKTSDSLKFYLINLYEKNKVSTETIF